jgi:hypothetical protein
MSLIFIAAGGLLFVIVIVAAVRKKRSHVKEAIVMTNMNMSTTVRNRHSVSIKILKGVDGKIKLEVREDDVDAGDASSANSLSGGSGAVSDDEECDEEAREAAKYAASARRMSRGRLSQSARRSVIMRKSQADMKAATDENGVVRL